MATSSDLIFEKASDYLRLELQMRQARRPAYSLRAFARDLQVSPASLTEFLNNRQGMSQERLTSIAKFLKWAPERREHVWDLIQSRFHRDQAIRRGAMIRAQARCKEIPTRVRVDSFKLIADWYHFALVELVRIEELPLSEKEMASRLDISITTVREAVARLERLGYLTKVDGRWRNNTVVLHAGDEAPNEAVRLFHAQILDLAQKALVERPIEERESLSVVYSIANSNMPKVRQELRDAVISILAKHTSDDGADSVQALTLQLFPLFSGTDKTGKDKSGGEKR